MLPEIYKPKTYELETNERKNISRIYELKTYEPLRLSGEEKDPRLRISFKRERRNTWQSRPNGSGKFFLIKTLTKEVPPSGRSRRACAENHGKETWHVFDPQETSRDSCGLKRGNYSLIHLVSHVKD